MDQVLNRTINYYNGALSTAYSRIANLEAEVTCLWGELTRLPGGNIASKTKVPEPPTFAGSENKMQLHDWLSQIALYCSASGITADDQKIICALTCLHAPASTYMKSYYDKVQAGQSVGVSRGHRLWDLHEMSCEQEMSTSVHVCILLPSWIRVGTMGQ